MLTRVTVDIIIPFWGHPALLVESVRSVIAQTSSDWRLTVLDDSSGHDVEAILAEFRSDKVRVMRTEHNLGVTGAFARCVEVAESDYVCIPGFDDLLCANFVEMVSAFVVEKPDVDVLQVGVRVVNVKGEEFSPLVDRVKRALRPRSEAGELVGEALAMSLLRGDWLYWPSLVFKTTTLKSVRFRAEYSIIQDLALLIDMAVSGAALGFTKEIGFSYRRHSSSLSQTSLLNGRRFDEELAYYRLAVQIMQKRGWYGAARTARRRLISRVHAAVALPRVLVRGTSHGRASTINLIFGA